MTFDIKHPAVQSFDVIIIGSGPTALGTAQRLLELMNRKFPNLSIAILEQNGKTGGLASSERDDQGFLWDMGDISFFHIMNTLMTRSIRA